MQMRNVFICNENFVILRKQVSGLRFTLKTEDIVKNLLFLILALATAAGVKADDGKSGLDRKNFARYWHVESESPDYKLNFMGDTLEIISPEGLTLWRNAEMSGDVTIEYDACVMAEGEDDRLSDLNCFWMASDPEHPGDIRAREGWRQGKFVNCYTLQLYYLGYGGNYNSTTRFRRYDGNPAGVTDAEARPKILTEYTDPEHLLKAGKWYHVRIVNRGHHVEYWIDGERLVDFRDPQPLTRGWFGFRTTKSRTRIANFSYKSEDPQPSEVALRRVGAIPAAAKGVSFGVPFDKGTVSTTTPLSLFAEDGSEIESSAWPMAYWPDGSVKWMAMAATLPAGTANPRVKIGKEAVSKKRQTKTQPSLLTREGKGYRIDTGETCVYISQQGTALIDSIVMKDGRTVARNVRLVASTVSTPEEGVAKTYRHFESRVDSIVVERDFGVCTSLKLTGRHCAEEAEGARSWLPFTVRLYFYKGSPEIAMNHTIIYDGEQERDFISGLGVRADVPMEGELYNRHVAFAGADGGIWVEPVQPLVGRRIAALKSDPKGGMDVRRRQMAGERIEGREAFDDKSQELFDNWAAWDGYRLSQPSPHGFTIKKRATASTPWTGTFSADRTTGYAWAGDTEGGLGMMVKDFREACPSAMEVADARTDCATLTAWLWSPDAAPMDLRHYDERAHGLNASYEDVQEGMSTPYGIARTSTLYLLPTSGYRGKAEAARQAEQLCASGPVTPTPEYLQRRQAFGIWSLPDRSTPERAAVEDRLDTYLDFYRGAIEQNSWMGFWNYGDVMHAYDPVRHTWLYDVGGFAWDNTELGSNLWLWYSFLRTGRADVWRMAEAMARHASEVDVYHIGPNAGLGSRHNVSHWGCGAKEARISQAAFNRFLYYLTADERSAELMDEVADNDQMLYTIDPMRLAQPREQYPCTAPARLRIGPDWMAYAGNWFAKWERTLDPAYRDKIATGMKSIAALPGQIFTGPLALGYDPATGVVTTECDSTLRTTNHLMTIMGGFEVMNEVMPALGIAEWDEAWLDHAARYKKMARELRGNKFRVSRLQAYAAWHKADKALASEAWDDLLHRLEHTPAPPFERLTVEAPEVPSGSYDEIPSISTNDAALWSLDAIYMQEVIPQ